MKKLSRWILGILFLSGCTTTPPRETQPADAFSIAEYTSVKLDEGTYRISFLGESVTTSTRSADFARLQSAAIASKDGYRYFLINKYFVTSPGTSGSVPDVSPGNKKLAAGGNLPTNTLIIRCFKNRPADTPSAVYDASEVSKRIRSQYKVR